MFNCSLIVKDASENYGFVFDSLNPTNRIFLSVRETPSPTSAINKITICEYDLSNNSIEKIYPVATHGLPGNYEDARFFYYKNRLGISYTYKMSITASFLGDDFTITHKDIIPIKHKFSSVEKNWTFVERGNEFFALRNYCPIEVYKVNMKSGGEITPYVKWDWTYSSARLRGGSPPVFLDNKYYMVLHSAVTYQMYMLVVDANTFKPLQISGDSLIRDIKTKFQFPCGLLYDTATSEWIVSLGIDDAKCGIVRFKKDNLLLHNIASVTEDTLFKKYVLRNGIIKDIGESTGADSLLREIGLLREEMTLLRKFIMEGPSKEFL